MYESKRSQTKQTKSIMNRNTPMKKLMKTSILLNKMIMKGYDYSYSKFYLDHLYHDVKHALNTKEH